jgi:MarR family transcriptional regulator, organic hydroperoxide resistance regulator
MDYRAMAEAMLSRMFTLNTTRPQRYINEGMRGEGFVLQYVIHRGKPVPPSEISGFMNISTARIAAALGSLERKGLVTRRIDPDDRRRILVDLTDAGRAFASEKEEHMLSHTTQLLEALGEQDATDLLRLINRVAEIMATFHCNG